MSDYAEIVNGVVVNKIEADASHVSGLPGTWVEYTTPVDIGWLWDGSNFSAPPPPAPVTRYLLTGPEWVQTFTDDEWNWIKDQRTQTPATTASKGLDKMMDAIRWTNSVDVSHPNMDQFYTWLVNNGIPGGQTRIDELREGILE